MSNLNILISGSGIAGSVFAFWLLRAHPNANITIVERNPSLRLTGSSVDIRSTAVDIIKWMGTEQEIRNHSTREEGMQFVGADGKEIATLGASGKSDFQSITSEFEISRGSLAKIFIDLVMEQVELIFDDYVDHYDRHDDGVVVMFANSKQVKKYDLLVAADGLGSKIRGMMLDTKPQEQLYDQGVYVAYFTAKGDLLNGGRLAKMYTATGGRVILIRPDPDPAGRTKVVLMNVTTNGDVETRQKLNKAIREGNESYMNLLAETFSDMEWMAPEVLQSMRESDDFYCSIFGQIRSPKLHDGRVVLLGDAAYATPGFGTSLAIIGSYVLAGELLNHPGDVKTALKRYEEMLLPFAKGAQGSESGDGAMQLLSPQTPWGISIRNKILWFVTWAKLDKLAATGASMLGFSERKITMPDYQWPVE